MYHIELTLASVTATASEHTTDSAQNFDISRFDCTAITVGEYRKIRYNQDMYTSGTGDTELEYKLWHYFITEKLLLEQCSATHYEPLTWQNIARHRQHSVHKHHAAVWLPSAPNCLELSAFSAKI